MHGITRIITFLRQPWRIVYGLNETRIAPILPTRLVIRCTYRTVFGRKLNLSHPQSFNEKLQWLKLYDKNPKHTMLVDKYEVKKYVAERIGNEHIIPTYGVWDDPNDIDFASLPDSFVLKTTHDSHGLVICKNKHELNVEQTKKALSGWLHRNYFYGGREWPYKHVQHRILAEKFMQDGNEGLTDLKVHCFNGEPKFILVCSDRYTGTGLKEVFYDINWNKMPVQRPGCENDTILIPQPKHLQDLLAYSRILSAEIRFVRVDFYEINGVLYFGELTFFPASGYKEFIPETYDNLFGEMLLL